ncbi:TnsD family Tn7-like transposition protein [Glaciecola sp. HTCC2999]|uniref:TnsD family Tn7-like transposition protein n=1 Tax=Glaciecola sp. HTCC2999 TaxID=455436 RepID=UPI0000E0EE6D|nr:TnsD family Tn7-like transposition protein [Glaciecola sp. HTCC2999]
MLAYFPVPYEDELLYSVIARYAVHTGQLENRQAVSRDIFGKHTAVAIPDLPSHLQVFTERVSVVWKVDVEEIIKRHTLAPIYFPFLNTQQSAQVIQSMYSEQGGSIHTRAGIAASSVQKPECFRYCPQCYHEQKEDLGEPYWNRLNQIAGVNVCIKHSCLLRTSDLPLHSKQKHLYKSASLIGEITESQSLEITDIERQLVNRFEALLTNPVLSGFTEHQWSMFYLNVAKDLNFSRGNQADHKKIREKFEADWSHLESKIYKLDTSDNNWLICLFRKHRKSFHPLRHLMVWCSLLPDISNDEIFRKVSKLPKTLKVPKSQKKNTEVVESTLLEAKRKEWLELLEKHSDLGVKQIRAASIGGALYAWLYRNDPNWLMKNKPKVTAKVENRYEPDYLSWDKDNIELLNTLLAEQLANPERNRLSKHFFIKKLPRSNSVEKHLADLTATDNWLNAHAESIEQYQSFRLSRAADKLKEQNLPVQRWRLLRISGIRKESLTSLLDQKIIELEAC